METDIFQGWYVLKGDNTLKRAMNKTKLDNILDYQKDQLEQAFQFCKNFTHAIDVGANYGLMSYNLSKKFKKVSAFEVAPDITHCLRLNVNKFNLDNVCIYDCGLGDKKQNVLLNFNPESTFSTHIDSNNGTKNALIERLDSFDFKEVEFIKIDAEGFESFIIRGGLETIKKYRPVILYERKGHDLRYGLEKNVVLNLLENYGYKELARIDRKNALIGVI